jgi:ABC-type sugar transport system permease subunit
MTIDTLLRPSWRRYLYLVPAVGFFAVFVAWPIISVVQASLTIHDQGGGVGFLANFRTVLNDPVFWTATRNMAYWAVITVTVQMVVGFTLAYLIETYAQRSKAILRTAFLVPLVTSASVIAIVWSQIYSPDYGPLQHALSKIGVNLDISLLGSPHTAIFAIIAINVWEFTGFSMLMYIVGLNRIPSELTEAARVDGATGFRLTRSVLVPLLAPITKSLVMLGIIGALQTFPLVYLTTSGGPNHASEIYGTQIFRTGFLLNQNGYASALAVLTLVIALLATTVQVGVFGTRLTVGGNS